MADPTAAGRVENVDVHIHIQQNDREVAQPPIPRRVIANSEIGPGLCALMTSSCFQCTSSDAKGEPKEVQNLFRTNRKKDQSAADSKNNPSTCTKLIFICLTILVVLFFVLSSLALTIRLIIGEFLCHKPSINGVLLNYTDDVYFDRLSDILLIPVGFLHVPEHLYFFIYLYKFLQSYKKWKECYRRALQIKMNTFVCAKKSRSYIYVLVIVLFMLVGFGLPPLCIARVYYENSGVQVEQCSSKFALTTRILTHTYHTTSFLTNGVVVIVRAVMILFTVLVGVMWRRVKPQMDQDDNIDVDSERSNHESANAATVLILSKDENFKVVCERHRKYLNEYAAIAKYVTPIYKIFRSFFVLQWIIHLFGLFSHIAHLIRPWIRYGQVINADTLIVTHQIYQFLFILFDGLALIIAHICALKMNSYLRRYIREVQGKQLAEAKGSNVQYSLTHLFLIQNESVSKSNFTPRIPGTGLSISINSPSFVVSIVLSTFALIGALVAF
jgi:hypothetical protein